VISSRYRLRRGYCKMWESGRMASTVSAVGRSGCVLIFENAECNVEIWKNRQNPYFSRILCTLTWILRNSKICSDSKYCRRSGQLCGWFVSSCRADPEKKRKTTTTANGKWQRTRQTAAADWLLRDPTRSTSAEDQLQ
jgi:hypothetical protein